MNPFESPRIEDQADEIPANWKERVSILVMVSMMAFMYLALMYAMAATLTMAVQPHNFTGSFLFAVATILIVIISLVVLTLQLGFAGWTIWVAWKHGMRELARRIGVCD